VEEKGFPPPAPSARGSATAAAKKKPSRTFSAKSRCCTNRLAWGSNRGFGKMEQSGDLPTLKWEGP